jgi:glutamine synthetase
MPLVIEYVWFIHSNTLKGGEFRSKTRVLDLGTDEPVISQIPEWNFDGSSTGQATTEESEVLLKPYVLFPNPFQSVDNEYVCFCECFYPDWNPTEDNYRALLREYMNDHIEVWNAKFWFGFEQEFFIRPATGFDPLVGARPQGPYYCSVEAGGNERVQKYLQKALRLGLTMGLKLTGVNLEVAPGQGEFQVCAEGAQAADQLIAMRWVLATLLAKEGLVADYVPKPLGPDWNGSGLHTNISTLSMRMEDASGGGCSGLAEIHQLLSVFRTRHAEHMAAYGEGNRERLTGAHETSSYDGFTVGIGSRAASIRIPTEVEKNGYGYFEDRRPAANADPYRITREVMRSYMAMLESSE